MKILNNETHIVSLRYNKLYIYDISTMTEIYSNKIKMISDIAISEENIFYACQNKIYILDIVNLCARVLLEHKNPVTYLCYLDTTIYFSDTQNGIYLHVIRGDEATLFKHFKHPSPITGLVSDGTMVAVSDMTNRLTTYNGDDVSCYDMVQPKLKFLRYIFASEKQNLFCLTHTTFGKFMTLPDQILNYCFSRDGAVLFVQFCGRIKVYESNTREEIKDIGHFFETFVYDDANNRLIGYLGKKMEIVENVLDRKYEEMSNLMFQEKVVHEKKGYLKETEDKDYKITNFDVLMNSERKKASKVSNRVDKPKKVKRSVTETKENDKFSEFKITRRKKLERLFDNEDEVVEKSDEESNETEVIIDKSEEIETSKHRPTVIDLESDESSDVIHEDSKILFYDNTGYLLFLKGPLSNKIEFKYHDIQKDTIEIEDTDDFVIGTFKNDYLLLSNKKKVFLYNKEDLVWTRSVSNKRVLFWKEYILAFSNTDLTVFNYVGEQLYNILMPKIDMVCGCDSYIAIFGEKLILTDIFNFTSDYTLPLKFSNAVFYNNCKLFASSKNTLYMFSNGLFFKALDEVYNLLYINKDKAICLGKNPRILPTPVAEYKTIPQDILSIGDVCSTYDNLVNNYSQRSNVNENSDRHLCTTQVSSLKDEVERNASCDESSLSDLEFDDAPKKVNTPTKKYNMFD